EHRFHEPRAQLEQMRDQRALGELLLFLLEDGFALLEEHHGFAASPPGATEFSCAESPALAPIVGSGSVRVSTGLAPSPGASVPFPAAGSDVADGGAVGVSGLGAGRGRVTSESCTSRSS